MRSTLRDLGFIALFSVVVSVIVTVLTIAVKHLDPVCCFTW